jgi:UDP-N-acetyl-D-mannosaminuronic acid transferase (WecB/TagA/CpsF family)
MFSRMERQWCGREKGSTQRGVGGGSTVPTSQNGYWLSPQQVARDITSWGQLKSPWKNSSPTSKLGFPMPKSLGMRVLLFARESQASIVWVGLGTPKQDFEARRLAQNLPVTAMAVGAAFDFIAGTVPQAPQWIQKSGLEWSYRLAREPKRLAKRYFWGNPQFIRSVIKHRP